MNKKMKFEVLKECRSSLAFRVIGFIEKILEGGK